VAEFSGFTGIVWQNRRDELQSMTLKVIGINILNTLSPFQIGLATLYL